MTARALLFALFVALPAAAQSPPLTPEQFRTRLNGVFRTHDVSMQLGAWRPDAPGGLAVTALLTRDIRLTAQPGKGGEISSILFVMQSRQTIESVTGIVTTIAAATYVLNPELSPGGREELFGELGLFDAGWIARGLDGIASRHGITWRLLHPAASAPVVLVVTWEDEAVLAPLSL